MPSSIVVSVVIPAFEAARWIHGVLSSIAHQNLDLATIEVIVVDDGSTDDTASIAERAVDEFGLVATVIRTDNSGASAARNAGWRAASGEWIQFLDVDDELAPPKIATQLEAARAVDGRCAVIYSPWQRVVLEGESWVPKGPVEDPALGEPVRSIVEDQSFGYLGPCLIRRGALVALGGLDETKSLGEDLDLMLRLAIAGWSFRRAVSASPLYFYRQIPGSLWQRASVDPAALHGKNATEANAESYIRHAQDEKLSTQTRLALAFRFTSTYESARHVDKELSRVVLRQIAKLHLRTAPPNAPRSARILAPALGLSWAIRTHALLRDWFPA